MEEDRLVWSPDIVGCALFLVSGHLAMVGIAGGWRCFWRRRDLGWWIVAQELEHPAGPRRRRA